MKKKLLSWILSGALLASSLAVLPMANLTANISNANVTPVTANAAALHTVPCKTWSDVVNSINRCAKGDTVEITLSGEFEAKEQIVIKTPCTVIFKTENATIKDLVDKPLFYLDAENITLQFKNVKICGQEGKDSKRAIYVNDDHCTIQYGTFQNYTTTEGGAIFVNDSSCTISDATFNNCSAKANGGAIYLNGNVCAIKNCTFTGVSAINGSGGAVYVDNSDCKIEKSKFSDCKAANGGAIYMNEEGEITDCSFEKTSATFGGAICDNNTYGGDVIITRCEFTDCKALTSIVTGVGNWVYGNDDARAIDCTVGTEDDYVGMQSIQDETTVIKKVISDYAQLKTAIEEMKDGESVELTITNDIYTEDTIDIDADNCIVKFRSSSADKKVTISSEKDGEFNFMDVDGEHVTLDFTGTVIIDSFYENAAFSSGGGAILVTPGEDYCTIKNGTFKNCKAQSKGGAICFYESCDSIVENCTFINCQSVDDGGGAISFSHGSKRGVVRECTFENNKCVNDVISTSDGTEYCYGDDVEGYADTKVIDCKSNAARGDHYYECVVTPQETFNYEIKTSADLKTALETIGQYDVVKYIVLNTTEITVSDKIVMSSAAEYNFVLGEGIEECLIKSSNDDKPLFEAKLDNETKITFAEGIKMSSKNNDGNGGAIYIRTGSDTVTIEGGYFFNCYAEEDGGAIYLGGKAVVKLATFENCEAGNDGGALLVNDDSTIEKCKFINNKCGDDGGSIYDGNNVGDVYITACEFSGGSCGDYGIWVDCNGDAHISGCTPGGSKYYNDPESIDNYSTGSIFSEGNALILFIVAEAATIAITILVTMVVFKKKRK